MKVVYVIIVIIWDINMGELSVENVLVEAEKEAFFPPKLWVITYDIRGIGKGTAMVKASNPECAEQTLKTNGMYNGTPEVYLVTKIEEVVVPPCNGLMAEQNVEFFNNN